MANANVKIPIGKGRLDPGSEEDGGRRGSKKASFVCSVRLVEQRCCGVASEELVATES